MIVAAFMLCGCEERKDDTIIIFGTSADYPPFEFYKDGNLSGFDIDLANAVAKKLGKTAKFEDAQFSSIFAGLGSGTIDVGIASLNPTAERQKNYDFSIVYYRSVMALVHKRNDVKLNTDDMANVKVACQLGSTQESWMRQNRRQANIMLIDNVVQAVELIKAGRVDGVLVDGAIASTLCSENSVLVFTVVADLSDSDEGGSAMVVKKGSSLKKQLDDAIRELDESGELLAIKKKWNLVCE
jgi:polar amino acid transport system substrate-binding protein